MGAVEILVLSARPELETNRRLVEAGRLLGAGVRIVDATRLVAGAGGRSLLAADGRDLLDPLPDAVLARVGNWRPESLLAALETLAAAGVPTPNPPDAMRAGRDHWLTVRLLDGAGIPVPRTLAGADPERLAEAAAALLGFPVVVKQRRSRMGVGVIRCTARDQLEAVLDSLWRVGDEVVVQELVPAGGVSLRLLVAGGGIAAAARFVAREGEWRSNAARGAAAEAVEPEPAAAGLALAAARAVGLGICGVDLLPGPAGLVVGEVNPTPGFRHLERATGRDVAAAVVRAVMEVSERGCAGRTPS